VYCGRHVTKLYGAGRLFACRHCYRLAYASQQESAHQRGLLKLQKIRMRLGGSLSMLDEFPDKPKGMHWRTYDRLRGLHDAAENRSTMGLMSFRRRLINAAQGWLVLASRLRRLEVALEPQRQIASEK